MCVYMRKILKYCLIGLISSGIFNTFSAHLVYSVQNNVSVLVEPIRKSSSIEIVSLDPYYFSRHYVESIIAGKWHNFKEAGRAQITDKQIINQIADVFDQSLVSPAISTQCIFEPRHGIEVEGHYYIICFKCGDVIIDGQSLSIRSGKEIFNRIWQDAKLKVVE